MRRWLVRRSWNGGLIAAGLVAGLVLGAVGGRVEWDGAATTLGGLVLVIAGIQLVHIWRA